MAKSRGAPVCRPLRCATTKELGCCRRRRVSKRRSYDSKVIGRIRIILLALDAGFTVKETKTFLSGYPLSTTPAERWRALATKKLAELDAQITRLAQMKSILNDSFHCRCVRIEDCEKYMPPTNRVAQ